MYKTDGWNRSFLLALGLLPYKYSIINSDIYIYVIVRVPSNGARSDTCSVSEFLSVKEK